MAAVALGVAEDFAGSTLLLSTQARNSLYPTDKMIAPRNNPMRPMAMKPPMTPRNTTAMGTAAPRPRSTGFRTLSISPTMMHQTRKITALVPDAIANP